jgi:uncharacterized tellurite resistance protein B-like protein
MMFFKKKINKIDNKDLTMIAALLVHAAKIDENYTNHEEEIIKKTILEISNEDLNLEEIIENAKNIEKDSNQILDFTKKVKNTSDENKIKIVESLWKIIYSNKEADVYETNLMRRLAGLLYIDSKTMGDIKEKIKNNNS